MCQKQLEVELATHRRELAMIETNNYNAHHNVYNQAPNSSLHFDGPNFHMCIMPMQHLKYNQLYRSITSRCNCTFFDIMTTSTLELQSDYRGLKMREPPSFPLIHTTKKFWGGKRINWFVACKKSIKTLNTKQGVGDLRRPWYFSRHIKVEISCCLKLQMKVWGFLSLLHGWRVKTWISE